MALTGQCPDVRELYRHPVAGVLGMEVTDEWKDARKVEEYVQQEFDQRFDATWFDSFGFNNTYAW